RTETKIAGVMIGRAAMSAPWIFRQIKYYLVTGELLPAPELSERWNVIIEHCRRHADDWGDEEQAIRSMRARLMAYSKNLPEAKALRERFQQVCTLGEIEDIAETHQAGPKEGLRPTASRLEPADTRRTAAPSVLNYSPTA